MTKKKRLLYVIPSVTLAACMAFGIAACTTNNYYINYPEEEDGGIDEPYEDPFEYPEDDEDDDGYTIPGSDVTDNPGDVGKEEEPDTRAVHKYVNMAHEPGTEINVAIGYNSSNTGLFYGPDVGSGHTFVGGYDAYAYSPKPVAKAIMDELDIKLVDRYDGSSTSNNLTNLVNNLSWNKTVDMATSDLTVARTQAENGTVLNLADYLQYMPNFQKFLNDNPVTYLSLLGYGMDTETGEGGGLYVAPYFDGIDDMEKGVLMRHDWVEDVLDYEEWSGSTAGDSSHASDDTFRTACYTVTSTDYNGRYVQTEADGTSAKSYMGTTGSWPIVSTAEPTDGDYSSDGSETVTVTKNYDAALATLQTDSSDLRKAFLAVAGDSYDTTKLSSGNIVDIMNAALETDETGAVGLDATGEQLAELYRAYIAAAYSVNGAPYYGTADVPFSKVFTGYSACWDVDDLTALLRIIKCSSGQVGLDNGQKTTGIFPRDYTNNRTPDIVSLVGELYGCRGVTSRYENAYIDSDGALKDARGDEKFWDSLEAFGGLAAEGLVDSGYVMNGGYNSQSSTYQDDMHGTTYTKGIGFMQWDYSQTQTTQLFDGTPDADHNYGWVNTPVSLWDDGTTNDSGYSYTAGGEKYMRFTESWRSVKIAGVVVAANVAKDPDKLAACLSFIDYIYSADGQITTTYGMRDETGNSAAPDGTWYGTEIKDADPEEVCGVTTQWIIKEEYADRYVVSGDEIWAIVDKESATYEKTGLNVAAYAENESYARYYVKDEYKSQFFVYGGVLYAGTLYKGVMTPTITDELYERFTSSDAAVSQEYAVYGSMVRGSFTNFARYILGSTLPICVKDQSFENQLTAFIAQNDATRLETSIANGTINHCSLTVTDNMFYTCMPTNLPLSSEDLALVDDSSQNTLKWLTGTAYGGNSFWSVFHWVIWFGYEGTYNLNGCTLSFESEGITSSSEMVRYMNSIGLSERTAVNGRGWQTCLTYWDCLFGA